MRRAREWRLSLNGKCERKAEAELGVRAGFESNEVFPYYASSDTRLHVATSDNETLLDYVLNNPADPLRSAGCVEQRKALISRNMDSCRRTGQAKRI